MGLPWHASDYVLLWSRGGEYSLQLRGRFESLLGRVGGPWPVDGAQGAGSCVYALVLLAVRVVDVAVPPDGQDWP